MSKTGEEMIKVTVSTNPDMITFQIQPKSKRTTKVNRVSLGIDWNGEGMLPLNEVQLDSLKCILAGEDSLDEEWVFTTWDDLVIEV